MEDINYYLVKVWQTQPFQQETPEGEILKEAPGTRVLCWTGFGGFGEPHGLGSPYISFE